MQYAHLTSRALIRLTGSDRISFLQGLISNDAQLLEAGKTIYAAMLSPQGKFHYDFLLVPQGDAVLMDTEASRAPELLKRLQLYKLRANITLELLPPSFQVIAYWGGEEPKNLMMIADPRLPELEWRSYGEITIPAEYVAGDYEAHRLSLGIPDGSRDMIVDKSLLLECGFEELNGISFSKGCYVGQEVTARSKFRGQVKKQFYQMTTQSAALPNSGTPIFAGDVEVGEMRSSHGAQGLAILKTELISEQKLRAGDVEIFATLPAWKKNCSQ